MTINYIKENYTIDFANNLKNKNETSINLYTSDFDSSTTSQLPAGWTSNETGETEVSGPVIKENSGNSADKVLGLVGEVDAHGSVDDPPVASHSYRWIQLSQTFTVPIKISFKFIAGSSISVYGITDAPESEHGDHLYFQYKVGSSGTWTTMNTYENTSGQYENIFTKVFHSLDYGQKTNTPLYLRWICKTASNSYDHWGIDEIKIESPVISFRTTSNTPTSLRGGTVTKYYKTFLGERR